MEKMKTRAKDIKEVEKERIAKLNKKKLKLLQDKKIVKK